MNALNLKSYFCLFCLITLFSLQSHAATSITVNCTGPPVCLMGQEDSFVATFENTGDATIPLLQASVYLPNGGACQLTSSSCNLGSITEYSDSATCDITSFAPGQIAVFEVSCNFLAVRQSTSCDAVGVFGPSFEVGQSFLTINPPFKDSTANQTSDGQEADPVATFTGEYFFHEPPDLVQGSSPMPLGFSRYYASFLERDGVSNTGMGCNWMHNFNLSIQTTAQNYAVVTYQGGQQLFFEDQFAFEWPLVGDTNIQYTLHEDAANFVLTDPISKSMFTFDMSGNLTQIDDDHGNQIFVSTTAKKVTFATDSFGRMLIFTYDGSGFLTNVNDGTREVSFGYTGSNLTSCVDTMGFTNLYSYDLGNTNIGLLTAKTYPEGNTPYTQVYDAQGRVLTQSDAYANTSTFTYAENSTVTTDPLGNTRSHTYNSEGDLQSFTDESNLTVNYWYDSAKNRNKITDRKAETSTMGYHRLSGQLSAFTNANGAASTVSYTTKLKNMGSYNITTYYPSTIVFPDSTTVQLYYDTSGNVTSRTDRAGKTWLTSYNAYGRPLTSLNPNGGTTTYTYQFDQTLINSTDSDVGNTSYEYDSLYRMTNITLPDTSSTSYEYDANDRVTRRTDGNGNTHQFTYDNNNRLTQVTDPDFNITRFFYDDMNRTTQIVDRTGITRTFTYDERSGLATSTDGSGNTTSYVYDGTRRMTAVIDAHGNTNALTADIEGVLTSVANPLGLTSSRQNDPLGLPISTTDPLGKTTTYTYDSMNRLTQVADPLSRGVSYSYDSRGLLAGVTTPTIGSTIYERDNLGLLTKITDLNSNVWNFAYSTMGRPLANSDPLSNTNAITYDSVGRLGTRTFADSAVNSNEYDNASNRTRTYYSDGTDYNYEYDSLNRLTNAINGTTVQTVQRDAEGRVTGNIESGVAFGATYDSGGRLQTATYNNGAFTVTYGYDTLNRLISVSDNLVNGGMTFAYDIASRLTGITRTNGLNSIYTYDDVGRLTRIQAGAIIDVQYTYDSAGQVISAQYNTIPLDPASAITNRTQNFTYDSASQLSSGLYQYDLRGRLTNGPSGPLAWDDSSKLRDINNGAIKYEYDALGNLLTRVEAGNTNHYHYNLAIPSRPVIAERDDTASQWTYYNICTPNGILLYSIDAQAVIPYYYHFDNAGSTLALTDSGGGVTDSYAYNTYGEMLGQQGTSQQPYTFLGKYAVRWEAPASVYHTRARFYDPLGKRFLSREPIWPVLGSPKGLNPYQYGYLNPANFVDPMGTDSFSSCNVSDAGNNCTQIGTGLPNSSQEYTYDCEAGDGCFDGNSRYYNVSSPGKSCVPQTETESICMKICDSSFTDTWDAPVSYSSDGVLCLNKKDALMASSCPAPCAPLLLGSSALCRDDNGCSAATAMPMCSTLNSGFLITGDSCTTESSSSRDCGSAPCVDFGIPEIAFSAATLPCNLSPQAPELFSPDGMVCGYLPEPSDDFGLINPGTATVEFWDPTPGTPSVSWTVGSPPGNPVR